jgi:hypothetical protein
MNQTTSAGILLQKEALTRRTADILLSKTIVSADTMAAYFPQFIATFVFSLWNNQSFSSLSIKPVESLAHFAGFVKDLLRVTKLSFSVVMLSIKYIHRIKIRSTNLQGKPGSEYRLIVCALNLAMKYLVDNTYSNKTWHQLSNIPLHEINLAEKEFMTQLKYDLHVTEDKYYAWLWFVDDAFAKYKTIIELNMARQCLTPPLEAQLN